RKTGHGFYAYDDGRRGAVETDFAAGGPETLAATDIAERILAAVAVEAARAADEGVASTADIVTALRLGAAHPDRSLAMLSRG
ncbi:MAG: hypothetical protein ACRDIL_07270, partial [Candidatus Limnocylindrales bacterium]